jgi:hypothetical protein
MSHVTNRSCDHWTFEFQAHWSARRRGAKMGVSLCFIYFFVAATAEKKQPIRGLQLRPLGRQVRFLGQIVSKIKRFPKSGRRLIFGRSSKRSTDCLGGGDRSARAFQLALPARPLGPTSTERNGAPIQETPTRSGSLEPHLDGLIRPDYSNIRRLKSTRSSGQLLRV